MLSLSIYRQWTSANSYYEKNVATGAVRCIDDEIPFDIPQGWEWTKIGQIAFVTKLAGFEYTRYIAENLVPSGIPLFKGKNVQDGHLIYDFEAYIPESVSDELERSQITRTCLLTPYVGTIGNIALHNKPGKYHLGSNVGKIEFFNSIKTNVMEEYALFYLHSCHGYDELTKHKKATAQESISIEAIRDVYIAIPPIQEQRRIVSKIKSIDSGVKLYSALYQRLICLNSGIKSKLKKSVLQEAIQGKLVPQIESERTADELLDEIRTEKQRLVKEGKLKKSAIANESRIFRGDDNKYYEQIGAKISEIESIFEIPESWAWVKLPYIGSSILGKTLDKGKDSGMETPYLCSINVYWCGISTTTVKTTLFSESEREKYRLNKGDLLICEGGDVGRCSIWDSETPMWYQNALHRVRLNRNISPEFIKMIVEFYKHTGIIDRMCKGVTIKHFTQSLLYSLLLPLPPKQEQERIVTEYKRLLQKL